ncbi:hypothetical protein SDC9_211120 [bioreactor metagenome]|uniref:Uncharacterized protein n=1 Tax=bioreactor metagenome TaxID=1076179 RepID=A0A645JJF0_9ZZZZ
MSALMVAVFRFTASEASPMDFRQLQTTAKNTGRIRAITMASRHWMENITAREPTMVTAEMNKSSGP